MKRRKKTATLNLSPTNAQRLVAKHYVAFQDDPLVGFTVRLDQHLMRWAVRVPGLAGTFNEGAGFDLLFLFPDDYPAKPPKAVSKLFHPNIYPSGTLQANFLNAENDWVEIMDIKEILLSVQLFFHRYDNINPAQKAPFELARDDVKAFAARLRKQASEMPTGRPLPCVTPVGTVMADLRAMAAGYLESAPNYSFGGRGGSRKHDVLNSLLAVRSGNGEELDDTCKRRFVRSPSGQAVFGSMVALPYLRETRLGWAELRTRLAERHAEHAKERAIDAELARQRADDRAKRAERLLADAEGEIERLRLRLGEAQSDASLSISRATAADAGARACRARAAEAEAEVEQSQRMLEQIPPSSLCCVCYERARTVLLLPCTHFMFCTQCVDVIEREQSPCPICRASISGKIVCKLVE